MFCLLLGCTCLMYSCGHWGFVFESSFIQWIPCVESIVIPCVLDYIYFLARCVNCFGMPKYCNPESGSVQI